VGQVAGIFSVDARILSGLNADAATKLFRDLLWCEARRVNLSPHRVIISLKTNVADGGIDARIDGNPTVDSILTKGLTYFQLKTGQAFKLWQKSALRKELFGSSTAKPIEDKLAPEIRECLKNKGRYILVSFGYDLTPQQQSVAQKTLTELIIGCGYQNPAVEVLGQSQLVGLFSLFSSLAIKLLDKGDLPFLTVDEWKAMADMVQPLQISDGQRRIIEQIQAGLRGILYKHIRLIGEPGHGKTRLALEAVSVDDLAPTVIYVPHAEDLQYSRLLNELLRKDAEENAILVIDECSERERASIWNAFRTRQTIKLVTIDHGPERSRDETMLILELPRLDDEQIKAILVSYLPKGADPSHWVGWCQGSPRVAHAVGENLKLNPKDLLKSPATVPMWERFVAGYEKLDSKAAQDALIVLRHIALFTKFGFEDPVTDEAKFICQLVQRVDTSITWPRFQELIEKLRQRRILQGKRTLFIVPKALHIYLWIDYWNAYGRDFSFTDFFAEVPSQLRHWFLQFFIYGHASPVAQDAVVKILSPTGPFVDREFLSGQAGTQFIAYLAEADSANTLTLIERTFGTWTREELILFKGSRQNIVWALEKIAVWKEYFSRAAKMLIKLALTENSNYMNNSTGTLNSLFLIGTGWAGTQSPPEERFPVIQDLLASHDEQEITLGLFLCENWLSTKGGFRVVGAEYQGLRPELEFWRPRVWGEVFEAWRLCWRHLWSVSRSWVPERRRLANRVLVNAGLRLIYYKAVADEIIQTLFELTEDPATDTRQLTREVIREIRYRSDRLPRGVLSKLRDLDKKLTGESFWGRFSRFVLNTNLDEDYSFKGEVVKELSIPSRRVGKLVKEVVKEPTLLTDHLSDIVSAEGHRLTEFGQQLSEKLDGETIVSQIINAQLKVDPVRNTQFIGGYFIGFRKRNPEGWEECVNKLLASESTKDLGVTVVLWSGMSELILQNLLEMYRRKTINSSAFSRLAWNAAREGLSAMLVEDVLGALVTSGDTEALAVAIELTNYYFFNKEQPRTCDEQLLFNLLKAPYFFRNDSDTMVGYHWHSVAEGFRLRFPTRDLDLLYVILSQMEKLSGLRQLNCPAQIADAITYTHPDEAWSLISNILESDERNSWWLETWLGEEFGFDEEKQGGAIEALNPHAVVQWVMKNPGDRAWKILRCLPKTLDETPGGKLTRLFIETFGDDNDLAEDLIGHFWTGGWSWPESEYLARKRDKAREWLSKIKSGKILAWLYRYIEFLNKNIIGAELREEREF
jgi:hypothetical protein